MSLFSRQQLSSCIINDYHDLCHQYLSVIYHDISYPQAQKKFESINETPGEILFPSITKLLSYLPLTNQDIFLDLGSALGKVVIQFFLQSPVKQAIGIELLPTLHQAAMGACSRLQQDLPALFSAQRELSFIQGDFLQLPLQNATVVLINGVCFSPSILEALGKKIKNASHIHTILTLRPIGCLPIPFRKAIRVEGSWDSALCYVYSTVTDFAKFLG